MFDVNAIEPLGWALNCFRPVKTVGRSLDCQFVEGQSKFITSFLVFPIILTLALNIPLFRVINLDVEHDAILMFFMLLSFSLKQVIGGVIVIICFLPFKRRLDVQVVLAGYTIFVIYSPIFALIELPRTYSVDFIIAKVALQHLGIEDSIKFFLQGKASIPADSVLNWPTLTALFHWLDELTTILSLIEIVLVSECVSQLLMIKRFKSYIAVTIGTMMFFFPAILGTLMQIAVILMANK